MSIKYVNQFTHFTIILFSENKAFFHKHVGMQMHNELLLLYGKLIHL